MGDFDDAAGVGVVGVGVLDEEDAVMLGADTSNFLIEGLDVVPAAVEGDAAAVVGPHLGAGDADAIRGGRQTGVDVNVEVGVSARHLDLGVAGAERGKGVDLHGAQVTAQVVGNVPLVVDEGNDVELHGPRYEAGGRNTRGV